MAGTDNHILARDHGLDPRRFCIVRRYEDGHREEEARGLTLAEVGKYPIGLREDEYGRFHYVQMLTEQWDLVREKVF